MEKEFSELYFRPVAALAVAARGTVGHTRVETRVDTVDTDPLAGCQWVDGGRSPPDSAVRRGYRSRGPSADAAAPESADRGAGESAATHCPGRAQGSEF